MNEFRNHFKKYQIKNLKKKQKIKVKMRHVNRKFGSNKKLRLEWTMNGFGKNHLEKNLIQKIEKEH